MYVAVAIGDLLLAVALAAIRLSGHSHDTAPVWL